jgi:hypothetical protein
MEYNFKKIASAKNTMRRYNFRPAIIICIVVSCLLTACGNNEDETDKNEYVDILTKFTWRITEASGIIAFGTTDIDIEYARFLQDNMSSDYIRSEVDDCIRLDLYQDGKAHLHAYNKLMYRIGKWKLDGKKLTLIDLDPEMNEVEVNTTIDERGLTFRTENSEIAKIIVRTIADAGFFTFADETNYSSEFSSWADFVNWNRNLKITKADLKVTFYAMQRE